MSEAKIGEKRYYGQMPCIGIRPTIDGRRGVLKVRESLEEQTMTMAKSAAKLFQENLKYADGTPVKVVIADTTIGRVGEAAACADKFRREGVDITLTVTPCWCYGAETMDMDKSTIKAVWGFNGTERPGAVCPLSVFTDTMCRIAMIPRSPPTSAKNSSASDGPPSQSPPCVVNHISRSVRSAWVSADQSSIPTSLRITSACGWNPWTKSKSSAE